MPLVRISSRDSYYPLGRQEQQNAKRKEMTVRLGSAFPDLIASNGKALHLEPKTPAKAVQVTHHKFTGMDKNIPEVGIVIIFTESWLSKKQRKRTRAKLKKFIHSWFEENNYPVPDIALDCFWLKSHGFYLIGGKSAVW